MAKYSEQQMLAVNAVESLRAGVPTRNSTRQLPDIRQHLSDEIRNDLYTFAEGRVPRGRVVWGQYGQGKTHALTTVEHMALDMGFAVSMISLSREVSCHNLLQFYGRVAPMIRTPDSTMLGLERQLSVKRVADLADSPLREEDRYVHPLPSLILEDYFYTSGEEQNLLYGDLTGIRLPATELKRIHRQSRQTAMPKLTPFKKTEHACAYFGVMADVVRLCGYKGWVILVDEAELIGRLGNLSRLKAYRNLYWLLNWSGSQKYPIYTLVAAATRLQDDIWYGGNKDDRNCMPGFAEEKVGPEGRREMEEFFARAISEESLVVAPVASRDIITMLNALVTLHGKAYNWSATLDVGQLLAEVGSVPIRTYVRAALEALDLQYVYNEKIRLSATKLEEQSLEEDEGFFAAATANEEEV